MCACSVVYLARTPAQRNTHLRVLLHVHDAPACSANYMLHQYTRTLQDAAVMT